MEKKSNRLIDEKSPYLLQHAYNPVDWFPWCEDAFRKAEEEDKPIFLSVGYSTCHWCHVMEHESFEDEQVAKLMNENFVSIKVDREERPDIDGIYMTVCQMLTGSGGWPLTIIMTPDKKPFFAGTYFPKQGRFGRTGMLELLPKLKEIWANKRSDILSSAQSISEALRKPAAGTAESDPGPDHLDKAYEQLASRFDKNFGGFGSAPKFPTPHNLMFLLRYSKRKKNSTALEMVEKTLIKMRMGGIYDQVGFGFHRYSTDREWLVPHFEKMLYDQALLTIIYIEAYLLTKKEFYKKTASEILTYVMRDMTSPEGGFYSAEDADSEGEEGKFYLWDYKEFKNALTESESDAAVKYLGIEKGGNWTDQMHGGMNGTNILYINVLPEEQLHESDVRARELRGLVESARQKLFALREKRMRPFKDDKILTDWNGLMISAFSKAYQAIGNEEYLNAAKNAAGFILDKMTAPDGELFHRYRNGEAGIPAQLDDYAFMISGLLDLYEASFELKYIEKALTLNSYLSHHFKEKDEGAFYFPSDKSEDLLVRQKEIYDGAVPSGNSVEALNLLRLGRITGDKMYEEEAARIGSYFYNNISEYSSGYTYYLCALDFALGPSYEIVIAGEKNDAATKSMLGFIRGQFLPNKIIMLRSSDEETEKIAPFTKLQNKIDGRVSVYLCRNYVCSRPVTEIEELEELLNKENELM